MVKIQQGYKKFLYDIINCIYNKNMTIRDTAKELKCSKSKIHYHIHNSIRYFYPNYYKNICDILNQHFEIKCYNGGKARAKKIKENKI